jgi:uncharacterized protein YfaS (alpha-2-macroglobulin family)
MKKLFFLALISLSLITCKDKTADNNDNLFKFKEYIYNTTAGVVSVAETIEISFAKDVSDFKEATELKNGIVSISPKVKGKTYLKDARHIEFVPEEKLEPNTEYTVKVALSKLFSKVPSEFKKYQFQFKTIEPNFVINTRNLQSYSKKWQYLEGYLSSADILTLDQCKTIINAKQEGTNLSVKWQEISDREFEFTIDSIQRKENDSQIIVKWDGKPIAIDNKGENKVLIPGISNFSIVGVNVIQSPGQYLEINFSDPIKKQQNFRGLVTIEKAGRLKYAVDGNVLKVYPSNRLVGNIKTEIFAGIKSVDGYKLKKNYTEMVAFAQLKPEVRVLNQGVILPNSSDLTFNFEAVNLKSVTVRVIKIFEDNILQFLQENQLSSGNQHRIRQVGRSVAKKKITLIDNISQNNGKWKAYAVDLSKLIKADPGAIYRVELSFTINDALYQCGDKQANENNDEYDDEEYYDDDYYYEDDYDQYSAEEASDDDAREEQYWDNLIYSYKRYVYNWRERENPCHPAYYNADRVVAANILASNLGVIVKKGNNQNYHFAVTDILSTNPISDAKITLYNFQQQEIATLKTNKQGLAQYKSDKNAYFAIASQGASKTYIKLNDGNSLSLSKFNVSGKKLQKGLKGYLYGERGVWRPGDTLHLTFVLNDKANPIPKGHPIKFELRDARGQLVNKQLSAHSTNRFHKFIVPTDENAPTGNWNATVSVGAVKFNKTLKVATVKPNRLKINLDFGTGKVIKASQGIRGDLSVNWLHGAPAKNVKANIQMKLRSTSTAFTDYPNYIFQDPTREFDSEEITIFEGTVNSEGKATINKKFPNTNAAPGMLKATFFTRAFENGGDFSMDVFTKNVAPYKSFVGLQSPEPRAYGSFFTDENTSFDVVTVNADGKPIQRKGLQVKVYKIRWRWWWSSSYDNLASYVSSSYHEKIYDKTINTNTSGKAAFTINIPNEKGGRYLIRVYDPVSGHATGRTAYFYRDWWKSPEGSDGQSASMLLFSTDKDKYNVGDTAHLTFPSGAEGRALISMENGSEVIEQRWVKTNKGETKVSIPITRDMAPNIYINISLLQPHAVTANDLPLRLYGVIPIMVEDPATRLQPQIYMPDVLEPEKDFTVKVSEKQGKAMTYTLAVVDEGLLDITRFKTPNIWNEFYQRQALGVTTWDIFDDVIGAYGGTIEQVFSIGGDEEAAAKKGKKANRFKPVVTYLGPFRLEKGKTAKHKIHMPNYIGSVRTMLIAGDNTKEAYGSAEKTTPVRKPLMLLASLPRKLSPGEKVTLPVTVFAMDKKVKNVSIQIKTSKGIKVINNSSQNLTFAKPDEKMIYYNLDISQAKGINTIEIIAKGNGEKAGYKVEIDVVNPNPVTSKFVNMELQANATQELSFETFGITGSNQASIELSTLPAMDFNRRMQYLIQYPHGCVEQTTSSVFPQLYLADIFDLSAQRKQEMQKNIKEGIKSLGLFQTADGGLGYWRGYRNSDDWGTSYAGHFMIEAEKKGYVLPLSFMSNWLRYQQQAARRWRPSYRIYNTDLAQAYRLYTLALAGHPDLASMNRLREFKELSNDGKWRLAAAYALAGQKEAAQKLANTANIDFKPYRYDYYTYGDVNRNRAMAMETMLLLNDKEYINMAKSIAKTLSSDSWLSTQTTAMSLLAMAKMLEKGGGKDLDVSYTINGTKDKIKTTKSVAERALDSKDGKNTVSITNNQDNVVFVRVLNSGKLPLGNEVVVKRNLSIDVTYLDTDGNRLNVSKLSQGTDFTAKVSITNTSRNYVENIALTEIFPSGWEIVNTGFTDYNGGATKADYTDIRDDRVNFYFNLSNGMTKTFVVQLNASYLGKYYRYGVQAEAMYDNDYLVRSKGSWIEVVK